MINYYGPSKNKQCYIWKSSIGYNLEWVKSDRIENVDKKILDVLLDFEISGTVELKQ